MRLSEWRKTAPNRECMSNTVLGVLTPVIGDLGAADDPECWVIWGEDPDIRYYVMVPTRAGMIWTAVRVNTPAAAARATGKLVRWPRLQLSELSVESAEGHRIVAVQVEGQVLKGVDDAADRICEFVRGLIGAVDGRDWQFSSDEATYALPATAPQTRAAPRRVAAKPAARTGSRPAAKPARVRSVATKPAATKPAAKPSAPQPTAKPAVKAAAPQPTTKPAAPKPAEKPIAPKPAARPKSAKPAPPKGPTTKALVPISPATTSRREPAPSESTRIAPHPIFAPVSTPPARGPHLEADEWGEADSAERADREARRPKTWTP
jgi:hypothetical protein